MADMARARTVTPAAGAPSSAPSGPRGGGRMRQGMLPVVLIAAVVLHVLALVVLDLPRPLVGVLALTGLILMMCLSVPVAVSMIIMSAIALWQLGGWRFVEFALQDAVFDGAASWQLSVVPLFVWMGLIIWRSGMSGAAFGAAHQWLGRLPGGLAIATNFAGAGLAAGSGSTIGISYALGRLAIPEMMRSGYSPSLAAGTVTIAGTLGQLIPPSVMLVVYAGIAQVPVGPQLLAAIVPAIILAVVYGLTILVWALVRPTAAPRAELPGITWRSRFRSAAGVLPLVFVVAVVIGGLYLGVFTSTEAGAFGVIAAMAGAWVSVGRGNRGPRAMAALFGRTLVESLAAVATIFLLVAAVYMLNQVMTLSRIANGLTEVIAGMGWDRVTLLLVLILLYLVLGTVLDPLTMILLTLPVLTPTLLDLEVDMLWYGVFIVMLAEIAIVTPPIGMLLFIVLRLTQDPEVNAGTRFTLSTVFRGVVPFIVANLLFLVVLILVPDLATFLPSTTTAE